MMLVVMIGLINNTLLIKIVFEASKVLDTKY